MKKILFLIDKIEGGGAENVLLKIGSHFSKFFKIYIIPNFDVKNQYLYKLEKFNYISPNIDIEYNKNFLYKGFSLIKYVKIVSTFIKKENPDYVVSFLERSNIVNVLTKLLYKHSAIISTRNNLTIQYQHKTKLEKFIIKFLINYLYNKSDLLIALSEGVKKDLIRNFSINSKLIKVIYNPYNINYIRKLSEEKIDNSYINSLFTNDFSCINVGRLTEQKGQIYLIRSFKYVVKEVPHAKLFIIGEGELYNTLKKEINLLNLSNNVFLLGYKKNPYKYINKSKIFLFSSLWEGFGNAIIEAMACGKPVISTNCQYGPEEILNGTNNCLSDKNVNFAKYGILTPIFNSDKEIYLYAEVVLKLLTDKKLYDFYSKRSLKRSYDFDEKKILSKWFNIIK